MNLIALIDEQALNIIREVKENNPGEWNNSDIIEALEGEELEYKGIYV